MIAEDLNPRASLIQGKTGAQLTGMDDSFDLLFCIGAHSMAGTQHGLMNHTIDVHNIMNYWINGVRVGEIGICAAIAGYYDVPLAMVSGDYWAVKEAKDLLGESSVEGAAVKKGINRYSAVCENPIKARAMIKDAARAAVAKCGKRGAHEIYRPYKLSGAVEIRIEYTATHFADNAETHRGAKREDGRSVSFTGSDLIAVLNQSG